MTKKDLQQIYYINREIKMWQNKLNSITEIGAVNITGVPGAHNISDSVSDMAMQKSELQTIIAGKLAELKIKRREVMNFINGIDDSLMRQIMQCRFIDCMSWRQVSEEVYGRYDKEDLARVSCNNFLRKKEIF